MSDCIFCKIVAGEIPSSKVYEDDFVFGFEDLHPQAPTHVLFVPKRHISSTAAATPNDVELMGKVLLAAATVARERGLDESGYRLLTNHGRDAGQTVFHLHVHLLGGKPIGPLAGG